MNPRLWISSRHLLVLLPLLVLSSPVVAAQDAGVNYDEISQEVSALRELENLQPIELTPMSRELLEQELKEDLDEDYPEDERIADARELVAFGLMDPSVDLGQLIVDLYTEQVAGYYDPETSEMVVIRTAANGEELIPTE